MAEFIDTATRVSGFLFHSFHFDDDDDDNDGPTILASALKRRSNLRELGLRKLQEKYLIAILEVLQSNRSLEELYVCLDITYTAATLSKFQALMRSTTNLRELHIGEREGQEKEYYMQVAKNNFSLRTAISAENPGYFDDEDRVLLQSYADRNVGVAQFLDRPATVPKNLLPEVLGTVAANPTMLFQSLKATSAVLFDSKQQRTRKRKRPNWYKPS